VTVIPVVIYFSYF